MSIDFNPGDSIVYHTPLHSAQKRPCARLTQVTYLDKCYINGNQEPKHLIRLSNGKRRHVASRWLYKNMSEALSQVLPDTDAYYKKMIAFHYEAIKALSVEAISELRMLKEEAVQHKN